MPNPPRRREVLKMRLSIWCVFIAGLLLVPNGALAELIPETAIDANDCTGDASFSGDAWSHDVSATGSGEQPYSTAFGAGHGSWVTTEAGYFSWSCSGSASGHVALSFSPPAAALWAAAGGTAGITSDVFGSNGVAARAGLGLYGDSGDYNGVDDPPGIWMGGAAWFGSYSGVGAGHNAYAGAGASTPAGGVATANGSGSGSCGMEI